jgi:hypothetical protein
MKKYSPKRNFILQETRQTPKSKNLILKAQNILMFRELHSKLNYNWLEHRPNAVRAKLVMDQNSLMLNRQRKPFLPQ